MKGSISGIRMLGAALAASTLAACGGGGGGGSSSMNGTAAGGYNGGGGTTATGTTTGTHYKVTNLASNGAGTTYRDAALENTWGIAFNPAGFAWVADNGSSMSTLYDGNGVPQSPTVAIPAGAGGAAHPTGVVFNGTTDFAVTKAPNTAASAFIFAGEAGTIAGWSPTVDLNNAVTAFDGNAGNNEFTGLAIGATGGANYLYAADFHNAAIVVFNRTFAKTVLAGTFTDPGLPAGYAPFGIQAIGTNLYVTYAKQDVAQRDSVAGAGLGIVDVFTMDGVFVKELIVGGALNAPWGIAKAPASFGPFSNDLLVANFGDGTINAFDPTTGAMKGTVTNSAGAKITLSGLWGIAFGNGINSQPTTTLFFAQGPNGGADGVLGESICSSPSFARGPNALAFGAARRRSPCSPLRCQGSS